MVKTGGSIVRKFVKLTEEREALRKKLASAQQKKDPFKTKKYNFHLRRVEFEILKT